MNDALGIHRLHFAFTITYHYLFPQLTMGLALFVAALKTQALRTGDAHYERCARFWIRVFAVNFVMGVVTGIPMEFQFGTNWARFSAAAGGVIGQTLAMEGVFAFFIESTFLGLLLFGERRLGPRLHALAAWVVFLGSWLSGYFIIVANAFMQHPVGHSLRPGGEIVLEDLGALLLQPWALWQTAHTLLGAVVTASFALAGVGAYYLLARRDETCARTFVRWGVVAGLAAALLQVFPTGDAQGKLVALHQPATLAAMEGLFESEHGAPLAILGQPDMERRRLDNPLVVPRMLSFLTYQRWHAEVRGLDAFPEEDWPDNVPLLYYSYHVMVGLGTIFIAVLLAAVVDLRRGRLFERRVLLWLLLLCVPLPFIANTAGWLTAELGRQPWLIHGLMRTAEGHSTHVSAGNGLFTLIGFMGLYAVLSLLYAFLMQRQIERGPGDAAAGY